ncbi:MAG TPA: NACHT domain-containing protein [Candidatus Limnocylindrales bacterium]|nr:NACHT domain-containing protein [Candidatus Limnocylindrales bacterium]
MPLADDIFTSIQSAAECLTGQRCPHVLPWLIARVLAIVAVLAVIGHYVGAFEGTLWLLKRLRLVKRPAAWQPAHLLRRNRFCDSLVAHLAHIATKDGWNDEHFIDLEAEVESPAVPGFFFRRGGLRRVSSLITAVERAREPYVIEGEPGSGKTVALRVLAKHYAERAKNSRDPCAKVPLYVNLRDLPPDPPATVDGEFLKRFVISSVRRGYDDNTAFVEENWDQYAERGLWLFLLDSFDEIPEILRGENGSAAVAKYSAAILELLGGTGCRGVVASRHFNGPVDLPWPKLLIVELSSRRQDALITKLKLSPVKAAIVRRYLAERASYARGQKTMGSNPFLLSLLCAYVKSHEGPLGDDLMLVLRHLITLAKAGKDEPARVSLSARVLIRYAGDVAIAFGFKPVLAREPLVAALGAAGIPEERARNVLGALVRVKILTSDTHEVPRSDERFAFAHRRYQETLLVRRIARDPTSVQAREFLERPVWREFAVTLLQSQLPQVVKRYLDTAAGMLSARAALQTKRPLAPDLGIDPALALGYFEWRDEPAVPLLELLQEGLARRMRVVSPAVGRRMRVVSPALSQAVLAFLGPRWEDGDMHDRINAVRLGGLLPQAILQKYLAYAFAVGTPAAARAASTQAVFLANIPVEMERFIRAQLADAVLSAVERLELWRVEAVAARLPEWLEARYAMRRARLLRALLSPFRWSMLLVVRLLRASRTMSLRRSVDGPEWIVFQSMFVIVPAWVVGQLLDKAIIPLRVGRALFGTYGAFVLVLVLLFCTRALGHVTRLRTVRADIAQLRVPRKLWWLLLFAAPPVAAALPLPKPISFALFAATVFALLMWLGYDAFETARRNIRERGWKRALRTLRRNRLCDAAIVARAHSFDEFSYWLTKDAKLLTSDIEAIRSVSRASLAARSTDLNAADVPWLRGRESGNATFRILDRRLEERLAGALGP